MYDRSLLSFSRRLFNFSSFKNSTFTVKILLPYFPLIRHKRINNRASNYRDSTSDSRCDLGVDIITGGKYLSSFFFFLEGTLDQRLYVSVSAIASFRAGPLNSADFALSAYTVAGSCGINSPWERLGWVNSIVGGSARLQSRLIAISLSLSHSLCMYFFSLFFSFTSLIPHNRRR